jgi:anthranilate synthase/aminodeoxychorismate synthase-like glutamine amidotransferase
MILIIDNYDSFTYNLVQYVGSITKKLKVIKNNELTIKQIKSLDISHIIISPGPGRPENTGVCLEVIQNISSKIPTLGICLGHQAIAYQYNATISKSKYIMHGKISKIKHNKKSNLFNNIPNIFNATRYHSLSIDKKFKSKYIEITSLSEDGEIMSIEHNQYPIFGIQFHPEAILTEYGLKIIDNFLKIIV